MGPRIDLDNLEKKKLCCLAWNPAMISRLSDPQRSQYIYYIILATYINLLKTKRNLL